MNYQKTKEVQEEASILELSSDNKVLIACDSAAKSVTIPQSVEEIDTAAFFACRRLKQIIIPDSVKIIRRNAFSLSRVRLIMIGKNVEMIERAAFADMTALEQIHVHLDNPYFNSQNGILYDKKMTTLLAYPAKCRIKEYTLPESVEVIGVQAIDENHTVTALHLNTNVREIAPYNISSCFRLKTLTLVPENPHFKLIDNVLYTASLETIISGTLNELKIVSIPTNVTKIYYDAFAYNSALEEVHIPSSISEIPFYAFCYCDNLRVVKLAEGVKKVSNIAFSGCDLEVLYLPRSITHIEADAFSSEELTVYYAASAEEFKNVEVHERNAALFNAKWHYNYVPA